MRAFAAEALRRYGYTVHEAANATDALACARRHRGELDAMITDVVLPDMNGRALASAVTQEQPSVRVMYMSGYTDGVIAQQGILETGTCFLQKPFAASALGGKLKELLLTA